VARFDLDSGWLLVNFALLLSHLDAYLGHLLQLVERETEIPRQARQRIDFELHEFSESDSADFGSSSLRDEPVRDVLCRHEHH
jgi:hypothetical protein